MYHLLPKKERKVSSLDTHIHTCAQTYPLTHTDTHLCGYEKRLSTWLFLKIVSFLTKGGGIE